ncbi:PREDICTED: uncharacterized protein LOC107195036 [Dufourea novaeangliae]|uniref:uncharacterized protein LOC107195036 n=1 Tax=Dufourea novaeangliae TaxID=178035 RepID=UPI000767C320|nr:PREDICTED: uncharacterized protein LOC107195036 [Dufourea novaeangliae]
MEEKEREGQTRKEGEWKAVILEVMKEVGRALEELKKERNTQRVSQGGGVIRGEQNIQAEIRVINKKLEKQERVERKNNIVIKGLKTKMTEAKEKVKEFLEKKFSVKKGVERIETKGREQDVSIVIVHLESLEIKQEWEGDYNTRIGNEGSIHRGQNEEARASRKSKDEVRNKEGERIIKWTEKEGLYIPNGNIKGDEEGEYTQVEKRGASVIDYIIVNKVGLDEVEKLQVDERIGSDHQPLKLVVKASRGSHPEKAERSRKRKFVGTKTIKRYKEATREITYDEEKERNRAWERLKEVGNDKVG